MPIAKTLVAVTLLALTSVNASAQNPVSDSLRSSWNSVKRNIRESAELMPEEHYTFKPTPDVRSFGEILAHVAGASFEFCASARNEAAPFAEDAFVGKMTTKAQIAKVTTDAIAYCDGAFAALTDVNAGEMVVQPFGGSKRTTRVNSLVGQIGHDNEHYGNLVTYFRLKGLVPPSSRRGQ
jgi:uncharacterized damage-inducible protein DinB